MIPCPDFHYAGDGEPSCTSCPAGKKCPDKTAAVDCAAGTYSLGQATDCTTCPAGHLCSDPASSPTACPGGTYNTDPTAKSCTQCPAGSVCPDASGTPIACPAGEADELID